LEKQEIYIETVPIHREMKVERQVMEDETVKLRGESAELK
jgi:hypothetical protein